MEVHQSAPSESTITDAMAEWKIHKKAMETLLKSHKKQENRIQQWNAKVSALWGNISVLGKEVQSISNRMEELEGQFDDADEDQEEDFTPDFNNSTIEHGDEDMGELEQKESKDNESDL